MAPKIHKTAEPVILDGYQSIMKPSEWGYTLSAVITDEKLIEALAAERKELIDTIVPKLKNPKRSTEKPEPWEEVAEGQYKIKFKWNAKTKPTIVDSEGTLVTDEGIKIYNGSRVKLAFVQKPYLLKDGVTYGTSVKLSGVQIISLPGAAGIPILSTEEATELFGKTEGGFSVEDAVDEAEVVDDLAEEDTEF